MGLFDRLKGKVGEPGQAAVTFPAVLGAPVQGAFVAMTQIPDEVFSTGVLGTCCGVEPDTGNVYAPIGGRVTQVADTLHAVGLEAGGIELLMRRSEAAPVFCALVRFCPGFCGTSPAGRPTSGRTGGNKAQSPP